MAEKQLSDYSDFEIAEELAKRVHEFDPDITAVIEPGLITLTRDVDEDDENQLVDVQFEFFFEGDGTEDDDDDEESSLNGQFSAVGIGGTVSS